MSEPDRYAVIGHPIAHSRSPWIHAEFARATGQSLHYTSIDATPEQLCGAVQSFFAGGGRGLNVTAPHKEAVVEMVQRLTERARVAGSVNTIARLEPEGLLGDNTDGVGFVRDLQHNLGIGIRGLRVLLLGAGGAARGLLAPVLAERPRELVIANRTAARAIALATRFAASGPVAGIGCDRLEPPAFDLIVNATAASLHQQLPPLSAGLVGPDTVCYDLAYGPGSTPFIEWARAHGAAVACMGAGMLVEQAAEAFLLWRGVRPDTADVLARLSAAGG